MIARKRNWTGYVARLNDNRWAERNDAQYLHNVNVGKPADKMNEPLKRHHGVM